MSGKHLNQVKREIELGVFDPGKETEGNLIKLAGAVDVKPTLPEREIHQTLTKGAKICADTVDAFDEAYCRMVKREMEMVESTKKHVSALKDRANAVGEALARVDRMMGPDFDARLQRLERFATAVNTLDALERSGRIGAILKALA